MSFLNMSDDTFKKIVAVLSALVAVLGAVVALLQSDASALDDTANRDTKRYALEALGLQVAGDARANYDYYGAYQGWYELDLLAASAEAREDPVAAARYQTLRDRLVQLSPLLQAPYFDPAVGEADSNRYEADVYLVKTTALTENFTAASVVKDAWDSKANTYIVHLTLMAVSLFMLALAATLSGKLTRWLFLGLGAGVALYVAGWAAMVYAEPVYDLRTTGAIDHYAAGQGLAYQGRHAEARAAYDQAIAAAPNYANALAARGDANFEEDNYPATIADYEAARAAGYSGPLVSGNLATAYYLEGRFDDSIALSRAALADKPDELWIRFNLALSLLAKGDVAAGTAEYRGALDQAAQRVAATTAAGGAPPYDLWWSLDQAAADLESLEWTLETGEGRPAKDKIGNPEAVYAAAEELTTEIKSTAAALEYTGKPPAGALEAEISEFTFAIPIVDEETGETVDYETAEVFPFGTDEVSVLFDYANMRPGQEVLFKVYVDGEEDPSWRLLFTWDEELGSEGTAERSISLAYSDIFVLTPGQYTVELYVDNHLAMTGYFEIEEE